jgi:hypothetical protein
LWQSTTKGKEMGYFLQDKYHDELHIKEIKGLFAVYICDLVIGDEIRYVHKSYDLQKIEDDSVHYYKILEIKSMGNDTEISFDNYQTVLFKAYDTVTVIRDA